MTCSNEVLEAGSRIQVVVRVRPVLPHEALEPVAVTCSQDGRKVQVAIPERESSKPAIAASSRPDAKAYGFDACLTGNTTQAQLFDICGIDELVDAAVDGYCCTVFAFGQTGSGKTYSVIGPSMAGFHQAAMSAASSSKAAQNVLQAPLASARSDGSAPQQEEPYSCHSSFKACNDCSAGETAHQQQPLGEDEGLLARCIAQLYNSITERQQEVSCRVMASCSEIYNEAVTDLLVQNKYRQLQVRQDSNTEAFYVEGLTQREATDQHMALTLMADALNFRQTRAHQLNSHSSRSHCLITFTITSQDLQQGSRGGVRRTGKLMLVDLAGSERLKDTGSSTKEAVRETGAINKSLFTLGQVLAALSVRGGCGVTGHVPYRDSRLTQLLWDGLRGGGRALMLACMSPLRAHADESLNTLHFASMALRIKSEPIIMVDPQDQMVLEMRSMIKALQEDCRSLAGAIAQMTSPGADMAAVLQALPPTLVQDALRYGGSSSAPTKDQRGLSSHSRSLRGSGTSGRSRIGSGDRIKTAGRLLKPNTADALLHHCLPALLSHSPADGSLLSFSKQHCSSSGKPRQQQEPPPWYGSPTLQSATLGLSRDPTSARVSADNLMASIGGSGGSGAKIRSNWPAYITPPRGRGLLNNCVRQGSYEVGRGSLQWPGDVAGVYKIGSQLLGRSGMAYSNANSNSASPWLGVSKYPGLAGRAAAVASGAYSSTGAGVASDMFNKAAAGNSMQPTRKSAEDFPALAAMEQQFQQQLQQQSTSAPSVEAAAKQMHVTAAAGLHPVGSIGLEAVQFAGTGSSGLLVPSSLPASIMQPRTLVPVRMSVADTEAVGTNPGASPVVVAIAAAHTHVRPLAVPLPPGGGAAAESTIQRASAVGQSGDMASQVAAIAAGIPEPKALHWAERNTWFGTDAEMTHLAYQVHDQLVENRVDPASDDYYAALEHHVAAAFPVKWAQHLAFLAAAGANTTAGRSKLQQHSPVTSYVSYKMSLKPSIAAICSNGTAARSLAPNTWKFGKSPLSPDNQQQQKQQHLQGPAATTLSQLIQHPALMQQSVHHDRLPQPLALQSHAAGTSQGQLPGSAFAEEMAQLYQQHTQQQPAQHQQLHASNGVERGSSSNSATGQAQQQQDIPQQGSPQLPAHVMADLPELTGCNSPTPAADACVGSGIDSPAAAYSFSNESPAGAQAIRRSVSPVGFSAMPVLQQPGQGLQLQTVPGKVIHNNSRNPVGVTAAAGQVLVSTAPSYYSGVGPLTTGARHSWSTSKYSQQMEAGKCLADVLRSGIAPGNKSLAELQADYRAARTLVLDQLRQQKEQAELQRRQILMQIGRAINSSKWRN